MMHLRLSRRDVTARFARGSLAYLLARTLPAHAQTRPRRLRRFVAVYMPEGPNPRWWDGGSTGFKLTNTWCPEGSGQEHPIGALSPILAGFERLKTDLLVLDGLSNEGWIRLNQGGDHFRGTATVLTGTTGGGTSVDQILAPVLKGADDHVRPSIHLGVGGGFSISRRNGQAVSGWRSPQDAFDKLFRDLGGGAPAAAAPPPGLPERERRKLLVDRYLDEYRTLRALVGREERERLDFNVEALADLQKRLAATGVAATSADLKCDGAALRASADWAVTGSWDKVAPRMMDVVATAFACDVTRVATVEIGHPYGDKMTYPWLGVNEPHHHWAHQFGSANPRRIATLGKVYRWYFDQVAYLAERLKLLRDRDGAPLLDSTAIITVSEFGDGHHLGTYMPTVLVGGRAAGVRSGRVIHYGSTWGHLVRPGACQPINRLHLTLCNDLAGMSLKSFGDPSFGSGGPLPGVV